MLPQTKVFEFDEETLAFVIGDGPRTRGWLHFKDSENSWAERFNDSQWPPGCWDECKGWFNNNVEPTAKEKRKFLDCLTATPRK